MAFNILHSGETIMDNIISPWLWPGGCGGGGGEGVELLLVGGEQGGVGSLGLRDRVDLRGKVRSEIWNETEIQEDVT